MARGSLYRRNGSWCFRVDVGVDGESGRRRQRSRQGFRTKREAGLALADALHDASRSTSRSGTSLAEFLDGWLEGEAVLVRPSTLHSYRSAVTRITAGLGAIPVARLDACDVQRLETCLGDGGRRDGSPLAPRTVANVYAVLHKAMEIAVRDGLCAANPVAAVAPPRPAPRQVQVWTTAELRRFLAVADEHRLGAAFMLLATTGMRRSEVLGVRWRDVDFEQRCMSVVQTLSMVNGKPVVETPKAAASRRCVDLDTRTIQRLQRHREQADAAAVYVFESTNGGPLNPASFSTTFERLARRADVPKIRLHDVRHTYATLALRNGMHPIELSARLGHATVSSTIDVYAHLIPMISRTSTEIVPTIIWGDTE